MKLSVDEFTFIRSLVRNHTGMNLGEDKAYLAESRLAELVRQQGLESLSSLIALLKGRNATDPLVHQACEAMTINETSFFRDFIPFDALQHTILPELIARRSSERRLKIWCAGCSTGQEPFSIAMLIDQHFPALTQWDVQIIATDVSHQVLERAREGRFSQMEMNRGLPAALLVRYFSRQGMNWFINPDIRRMVRFEYLSLANESFPIGDVDIIFIRNVLIYFDIEGKRAILQRVRQSLLTDGYMFLGSAETTLYLDDAFKPETINKAICYRLR